MIVRLTQGMLARTVTIIIAGFFLLACQGNGATPTEGGPAPSLEPTATSVPEATATLAPPASPTPLPATATSLPATPTQAAPRAFFLEVTEPEQESVVASAQIVVAGCTTPGAVVSVGDDVVDLDASGCFHTPLALEEGLNSIDVVASDIEGNQASVVLNVLYAP